MEQISDISDEEFVPFLNNLGVETYKKSFEWMLNDAEFAGVLRWLYTNLDNNNALSPREEYRYIELQKNACLLPSEKLEATIASIGEEYEGICLPGDEEAIEDTKLSINILKERLLLLEKQEVMTKNLIEQNELIKEELTLQTTKLSSAHQQSLDDEKAAATECTRLAEEVESITEEVVDVVADVLEVYRTSDKENSKKFFTFGPYDAYRQSQSLFRSHFDLFTSKHLNKYQNQSAADEDFSSALIEAKSMEERLLNAAHEYIESKAELCGEQAKLALVSNYNNVHPSQIANCMAQAQSALEFAEQEEIILEQEIQDAVRKLVDERTNLAVETTVRCALIIREEVCACAMWLLGACARGAALDACVCGALRADLRAARRAAAFARDLTEHLATEQRAVAGRIEAMNEICSEHESCELKLQSSDILTETLCAIFGGKPTDGSNLVKLYIDLQNNIKQLEDGIADVFKRKEDSIAAFKASASGIKSHLWSGSTRLPRCWDGRLSSLTYTLAQEMGRVERKVLAASGTFASVKNGDKQNLRKLWQWFLTDPNRLLAAVKVNKSYSR